MHPKTVKKILTDEVTLDIAKTAEAVRENACLRVKKDKLTSKLNSVKAYVQWLARQRKKEIACQKAEEFRQKLAKVWNKHKKV